MLTEYARQMRLMVLDAVTQARVSHIGPSLSCIELVAYIYHRRLDLAALRATALDRDYFIMSKGHAVPTLYAALVSVGMMTQELLNTYGENGSILAEHPIRKPTLGIEASTGSLGHGLSMGVGLALAQKQHASAKKVYVLLGDGELQEGANWEALHTIYAHNLTSLYMIVDNNHWQALARPEKLGTVNLVQRFESFGLATAEIDGHSFQDIASAFTFLDNVAKPKVIIAHTVKGKGVSFMEDALPWHYKSPNPQQYELARKEILES